MQVRPPRRSACPAACALDIAGDRWTLLVVRDLLRGRRTYGELAASDEAIPTNILAARLRRMQAAGLVVAKPYQKRPLRRAYELTAKGRDLAEVLAALARWGRRHVPGTRIPPEFRTPPTRAAPLPSAGSRARASRSPEASRRGSRRRSVPP
jgi:DNA-binding HxlR family transcriptional regulator